MKSGEMYRYYSENDFLPTVTHFENDERFSKYENGRCALFDRLKIPVSIFKNINLIEFGPDSGENTLLFAKWGAQVSIVEPNLKAKTQLLTNFEKFGLTPSLVGLSDVPLTLFSSELTYDFLVAEGFIFTIRPNQIWIDKSASLLKPGGLMLFSYMEAAGSLFELLLKLIYQNACEFNKEDSLAIAESLFSSKWNSIPHTRSFHSWYMDVIKNPYVRYQYFNYAENLIHECENAGLSLYSSWPSYEDALHITWHKSTDSAASRHNRMQTNIKRSVLSYLLGEKCFYTGQSDLILNQLGSYTDELLLLIDSQIDGIQRHTLNRGIELVDCLLHFITSEPFYFECDGQNSCVQKIGMLKDILKLVEADRYEDLVAYCHTQEIFIKTWGLPNHLVVLQKK